MAGLIACVTGGTGMVGRKIVQLLLQEGYEVRVLSRHPQSACAQMSFYTGRITNDEDLASFLQSAQIVFHCAAEIHHEESMWETNVLGTEKLIKHCKMACIQVFCFISSADVIGKAQTNIVTEKTPCFPRNTYEKSKWAAEQLVRQGVGKAQVCILRPTNLIDEEKPGPLGRVLHLSFKNSLLRWIKGRELTHLLHANDVASAALFLSKKTFTEPECFIMSLDDDPLNTLAGLWTLSQNAKKKRRKRLSWYLPLWVPHLLRHLQGQKANRGDVFYSSAKLRAAGFTYQVDLMTMINEHANKKSSTLTTTCSSITPQQ